MCAAYKGRRQRICETHDLELHGLAFKLNRANLEVNTDGANVALRVRIIGETEEKARLCAPDKGSVDRGWHGDRNETLNGPFRHRSRR